jgi:hypothetical protein
VLGDEVAQYQAQFGGVAEIAACPGSLDVVAYERADTGAAIRAVHEIATELGGDHRGQMTLLGDRIDLFLCELA